MTAHSSATAGSKTEMHIMRPLECDHELVFAEVTCNLGAGIIMRLDESLTGQGYVLVFPKPQVMEALETGTIDLRSAMLQPDCHIFLTEAIEQAGDIQSCVLTAVSGPLPENFLPDEGCFISTVVLDES